MLDDFIMKINVIKKLFFLANIYAQSTLFNKLTVLFINGKMYHFHSVNSSGPFVLKLELLCI